MNVKGIYNHTTTSYISKSEEKYSLKEYYKNKPSLLKDLINQKSIDNNDKKSYNHARVLDSSLNIQSKTRFFVENAKKTYFLKMYKMGDYTAIYYFNKLKTKKDRFYEKDSNLKKIDSEYLFKEENYDIKKTKDYIEYKNIMRSKFTLQRLVKANESKLKTFITLTFADNIKDIKKANSIFNKWRTYIKQLKSDFIYIAVPEFQKRGAVHYHLLTNIDYTDFDILSKEERKIYNKKSGWQVGRDIKGWKYGHNMAKDMKNENIVGYISKYMTKDIDNRLFTHNRYLASKKGLIYPEERYIDCNNEQDFNILLDTISNSKKIFENSYLDKAGELINFVEYKKVIK